jgi:predicted lactoylglutathione lyase
LPQRPELWEVLDSEAADTDIYSGFHPKTVQAGEYDVGGVLLPRPFKVKKVGPVNIFVADMGASERFYLERAGLVKTEEVDYRGNRCLFLRAGTEHHCLALFPMALRQQLDFNQQSTLAMLGLQLGSYAQLKAAIAYLKDNGLRPMNVASELHPGINYAAHFVGPDNHCIQLYFQMEQIGWDGRPRSPGQRKPIALPWPETLEGTAETYSDHLLQGPMG